jgi:hypothetical protein
MKKPLLGRAGRLLGALAVGTTLFSVIALSGTVPAGAVGVSGGGVVSHKDTPDPDVVYSGHGTTYYTYSTGTMGLVTADWTNGGIGYTPLSCTSGGCGITGVAHTALTAYTRPAIPRRLDLGLFGLQAPSVVHLNSGSWVMYYGGVEVTNPHNAYAVWDATATHPTAVDGFTSPLTEGPLMYQTATGGSTDPSVFTSPSGTHSLQWKSSTYRTDGDKARLWSMPLTATGLSVSGSASILITQPTTGWDSATVENPDMIYSGGTYDLFFSGGLWTTRTYAEGYVACSSPSGGCGAPTGAPVLSDSSSVPYGPGGASLFPSVTGSWLIAYHGWNTSCTKYVTSCNGLRQLYVSPMTGLAPTPLPTITRFTASPASLPSTGGTVTFSVISPNMTNYWISSSPAVAGLPAERPTIHLPANTTGAPITYTFTVTTNNTVGFETATASVTVAAATGQQAQSSGSMVVRPTGEVDQVVRTPSNTIEYYWRPAGGTWSSANIGGTATDYAFSSPEMFLHSDGQEDIVFEGTTHRLIYCYHFGTFTCETVASTNVDYSTPSIFVTPDQEVRVAYEGINNQLMYSYLFGSWTTLAISGDSFDYSAPSIFVSSSGQAVIANQGSNNQLFVSTPTSGTHWASVSVAGDYVDYSAPAVVVSRTGTIRVANEGNNRQLLYSWLPSGGSWSMTAVGIGATIDTRDFSIPSIGIKPTGQIEVVAEGINRQLMYNSLTGASWNTIAVGGDTIDFSSPSIAVHNTGEVDVAAQGVNRQLIYSAKIPGWTWVVIPIDGQDTLDID